VSIQANRPVSLTGFLDGHLLRFAEGASGGWTVVGFGPYAEVRPYLLQVVAVDRLNQQALVTAAIQVNPVSFGIDYLTIPPALQPLLDPELRRREAERVSKVLSGFTRPPLWHGPFSMPVQDAVTSPYGVGRSYNGQPVTSFHGGVDIRGDMGMPVYAANHGRVALAEKTQVRGNLVILDHGLGVYTAYAHLSEIKVAPDQMVQQGEIIGRVGSTGLVTGPHLHWEVVVGGVPVEPLEWTQRTIP